MLAFYLSIIETVSFFFVGANLLSYVFSRVILLTAFFEFLVYVLFICIVANAYRLHPVNTAIIRLIARYKVMITIFIVPLCIVVFFYHKSLIGYVGEKKQAYQHWKRQNELIARDKRLTPVLDSVEPDVGIQGQPILIKGRHFGDEIGPELTKKAVVINGVKLDIKTWKDTYILAELPVDISVGTHSLYIRKTLWWDQERLVYKSNALPFKRLDPRLSSSVEDDKIHEFFIKYQKLYDEYYQ